MPEKSELRLVRGEHAGPEREGSQTEIDLASYKKHTLPTDSVALENIEAVTILAGSHGQGENKDLVMHVKPVSGSIWYVVLDHQKETYHGFSLSEAIEAYNAI